MADNEFLRKKREREFQQLVLQSLEKPKTSKFLAFINSGFFLWFLSAVFVTAAGWYITNYQQCAAQSSELAENIRKLSAALSFHFDDFDTFIVAQTDVNSILQGSPGYATMRGEYDKRSVLEVNKELQTLMKKVNFSPWDDFLWPRPSEELKQTEQFYVRDIFTRPRRLNVSLDQLVDALRKLILPYVCICKPTPVLNLTSGHLEK